MTPRGLGRTAAIAALALALGASRDDPLAGRVAGEARGPLAVLRPECPVIAVPHPSPTYVCTAPDVRIRILDGFREAAWRLAPSRPSHARGTAT